MAEWSNAHRWKRCVPQGTAGSNPVLSAMLGIKWDNQNNYEKNYIYKKRFCVGEVGCG